MPEQPRLSFCCDKCGQTLQRITSLALLVHLGASVHPDPLDCPEGGDHVIAGEPITRSVDSNG